MCFQSWLVPELFIRPGDLEKREHFVAKHPRATLTLTFQQCILNCWYKKIAGHGRNWHKPCNGCRFESHETVNLITLSYKWTVWFIAGIKLMVTLEKKKENKTKSSRPHGWLRWHSDRLCYKNKGNWKHPCQFSLQASCVRLSKLLP